MESVGNGKKVSQGQAERNVLEGPKPHGRAKQLLEDGQIVNKLITSLKRYRCNVKMITF